MNLFMLPEVKTSKDYVIVKEKIHGEGVIFAGKRKCDRANLKYCGPFGFCQSYSKGCDLYSYNRNINLTAKNIFNIDTYFGKIKNKDTYKIITPFFLKNEFDTFYYHQLGGKIEYKKIYGANLKTPIEKYFLRVNMKDVKLKEISLLTYQFNYEEKNINYENEIWFYFDTIEKMCVAFEKYYYLFFIELQVMVGNKNDKFTSF